MRKVNRKLVFLLSLGIFLLIPIYLIIKQIGSKADAETTTDSYLKFYNFDPTAEKGSENNPFIILEIVPYRGMGQIGYLVDGQEPVDINLSTYAKPFWGEVNAFAYGGFSVVKKDKLDAADMTASDWTNQWSWTGSSLAAQTGYFQKLSTKTGYYDKTVDTNGKIIFKKNDKIAGSYNWISAANTQKTPTDYNADKVWMTNYSLDVSYWKPSNDWKFENLEIFKKQVLNVPADKIKDYHIRVVTITPSELNKNVEKFSKYYDLNDNGKNNKVKSGANTNGEIDLIGNADLVSISPQAQAGNDAVIKLWETYGRDKTGISTNSNRSNLKFSDSDLSWQTTMELFMKIGVVEDSAAFIYDITLMQPSGGTSVSGPVVTDNATGYTNNVYKLCLLLRQRAPRETYNLFFNTYGGTTTPYITQTTYSGKTTGSYNYSTLSTQERVYWSEYTLLPFYPDGSKPGWLSQDTYKNYLLSNNFLVSWIAGNQNTVVIRNTYSYNGDSSVVQYFLTKRELLDNTYTAYDYNAEFFDYLADKYGTRPTNATPCEATEYVLHRKNANLINKSSIKVLELEPCNDFALTAAYIKNLIPTFMGEVNIVKQTTAEFIGTTEDLNSTYDLIFIGTRTGKMKVESGVTVYNDPALNGLVYLHVGDRVLAYDSFKGILKNTSGTIVKAFDFINFNKGISDIFKSNSNFNYVKSTTDFYRYSGNDITQKKKQQLEDYINGGYPLILDKNIYNLNSAMIDNSSYIYDFADDNKSKPVILNWDNLYYPTNTTSLNKLTELAAKEKLTLDITKSPTEYDVSNSNSLIKDRTLTYEFTIKPPSDAISNDTYQWSVYVDNNADGRFIAKELITSGTASANAKVSITKKLSDKYSGVIPWKLVVKSNSNSSVRIEKNGYAAFKILESQKTPIHVLQITSNDSTLDLESLLNPGTKKTSLFYKYTKDLEDFNVIIKTINVTQFLNLYKGTGNAYDVTKPDITDKLTYTEDGEKKSYDMLIFGFGDCYTDITNENGALFNIQAFINSGKSVMFTHDTTSFVNLKGTEFTNLNSGLSNWGYGFNQYLRNKVGLDRFGVMKESGDTTPYDKATMPSSAKAKNLYYTGTITNNATTYPEIQGLTNGILAAFSNPQGNDYIYNADKDYPPFLTGNNFTDGNGISNYHTTKASKVNDGQVTNYPYKIPDTIDVSNTHIQYYQINMEDPEVVVWYCLSDSNGGTGAYSTSPNDVRNNYYIYSKGNIMYTGVGHSSIDKIVDEGSATSSNVNEVKLFINTMIASYSAGLTTPTVDITNSDIVKNSAGNYTMYEDTDAVKDLASQTKRINFIANDTNLVSENMVARIYYYDSNDNLILMNPVIKSADTNSTATSYQQIGQEAGYYVKNGYEYYFEFPLNTFAKNGSDKVYISVTNDENLKGNAKVSFIGRGLFDLD